MSGVNVYPPSEDSELLLEVTMREISLDDEVLEVGVGSGFVSERIMDLCKFLVATDISPCAVKESKSKGIYIIRTDLCRGIRKKFTLILFNPPYLELNEEEKKGDWLEKAINGGKNGIEVMLRFLNEVKEALADNGRILLVVSSFNKGIFKEIERMGYVYSIAGGRKLFFEELYVLKIQKR